MIDTQTQGSPGWWMAYLADRLTQRQSRITLLRSYIDGDAPLPEGAEGLREAYRSFQQKARTNFGELVVEAVQERMTPAGFQVGENRDLDKAANRIWAANELDVFSGDVHGDMLGVGDGYAIVGAPDSSGVPVITPEDPALVVTAHDPLRPHQIIAALKLFRDDIEGRDYAYLYLPGAIYVASKAAPGPGTDATLSIHGMEPEGAPRRLPFPVVPVVRFRNHNGVGEFEPHTDLLDRINYMVLQRLVITALQAFRQRAIKGDLPPTVDIFDDAGNVTKAPVDYGALFRPGPGALWMLPESAEMWESASTDIQPILSAVKDDIRDLAAASRTPMAMLLPDGANQSAEGASFAREGLIFKANDRIKRATYGWNRVMALALMFSGAPSDAVQTLWLPPERLSLAERADAASKATDIPWATKMASIWQYSPAEIERMEGERLSDVFVGGLGVTPGAE